MSTAMGHAEANETTRSCVTELVCQRCDVKRPITDTEAFCESCGKCFDIAYDYELAKSRLKESADERTAAQHLAVLRAAADPLGARSGRSGTDIGDDAADPGEQTR